MTIRICVKTTSIAAFLEKGGIILLIPILIWSLFRGVTLYAKVTAESAFRSGLPLTDGKRSRNSEDMATQLIALTATTLPVRSSRCSPLMDKELSWVVDGVTKKYSVESSLLRAIIDTESSRRPCITSPRGAIGLMQLMPGTLKDLGIEDPYDPRSNVEAGARYLMLMLKRYNNDVHRALSAYNAGPGVTDRHTGIPPIPETQRYVKTVLQRAEGLLLASAPITD